MVEEEPTTIEVALLGHCDRVAELINAFYPETVKVTGLHVQERYRARGIEIPREADLVMRGFDAPVEDEGEWVWTEEEEGRDGAGR